MEGKYDKIKLSSLIDGLIIETHGFQIFRDKKQLSFLRKMADTRGLLVLTDSDGAGFQIRHYLTGAIDPSKIKHAYIPDILGKERRKEKPSSEESWAWKACRWRSFEKRFCGRVCRVGKSRALCPRILSQSWICLRRGSPAVTTARPDGGAFWLPLVCRSIFPPIPWFPF